MAFVSTNHRRVGVYVQSQDRKSSGAPSRIILIHFVKIHRDIKLANIFVGMFKIAKPSFARN